MFTVEVFRAPELGNASFLIADPDHGVGLVVDPLRDIDHYLKRASELGVRLTHAFDTHLHNDFVSGRRELAAETGVGVNTLLSRKHYAVLHLRKRLQSIYDEFTKA